MSTARPPITCHVLDTLSGTPASSIPVRLTLLSSTPLDTRKPDISFSGVTNSDGRVTTWTPLSSTLEETFAAVAGDMQWAIVFHTGPYWQAKGVKAFFPEVEIKFVTEGFGGREGEEHWHVPLLLGPFSYTTYRGS